MRVDTHENELKIDGVSISFEQRIAKVVEVGAHVVVLLDADDFEDGASLANRNILAYDSAGKPLWRVEDAGISVRNRDGDYIPQPYLSLWVGKDGTSLHAGLGGVEVEIDPSNGMLVKMEEHRW